MAGYYEDIAHNGRIVGRRWVDPDAAPPKSRYTLAEWIDALTAAELDVILDLVSGDSGTANQKRQARRVWEYWRAANCVDFNLAKNVQVLTWLVANSGGIWTVDRTQELAG